MSARLAGADGDTRTLLGLHTRTAWFIFGLNTVVNLALVVWCGDRLSPLWLPLVGWCLVVASGAALLLVGGDPLPVWASACIALSGPLAVVLTVPAISMDTYDPHAIWMTGPVTCVLAYLCVRGRSAFGWLGLTTMIGALVVWTWRVGMGPTAGLVLAGSNFAALGMATFFAYTIRPAAESIYALRSREAQRAADEAGAAAILDVRDRRIEQLDTDARPLLQRIADGAELTTDERIECRMLEAHLRDGLRGTVLAAEPVVTAARAARLRGVEVVLLDDGAIASVDSPQARAVRATLATELDAARDGRVTARVLPTGRERLGTVVADTGTGYRRLEFGPTGEVVSVLVDDE
ncbi:hypothetical protein HH308_15015 [Gordonia sp. TBRC 11910]|uniref:Signal transduction histidine kinase n=1 Tax=Gordonia asplenii TaxID=2725283 RepID=A0A848L0D5_9ACTN|nr:hypothetical protein [Gordonia asplenii]NMO02525.1 hypothetical protein [Gordonia asplenii]